MAGGAGHKIPSWMRGGKPIGPDVREGHAEVQASKRSPGEVVWTQKNRGGAIWAWLIYDFAVRGTKLKPGHIRGLKFILKDLVPYGKLYGANAKILCCGHASPSGPDKANKNYALQRAGSVLMWLRNQPKVGGMWFDIPVTSETYNYSSYFEGRPIKANQRSLARSVLLILPHIRTQAKIELFPKIQRQRALDQISGKFSGYEEKFYYWVINNFDEIMKYRYCWRASSEKDGLFFRPPPSPLSTYQKTWNYLKPLYRELKLAADRTGRYGGASGSSMLRAPVLLNYQQRIRWILLDQKTRKGNILLRNVTAIAAFENEIKELVKWVYKGKYGDWRKVKTDIDNYAKKHKIPIKFPNRRDQERIIK